MTPLLLAAVIFIAALLQTTSGFGFALLAMPLVTLLLGVREAAPLVALLGWTLYLVNLLRNRRGVALPVLAPLAVAIAAGVPVGLWALTHLDERLVKQTLGVVLVLYAAYSWLKPHTAPRPHSKFWAYPAGFLAGCLGGAFNTPGPPVILYGDWQQWPRDLFRSTLQALFLFSSTLVLLSHAAEGRLTRAVWADYAGLVVALLIGVLAGAVIDRRLDKARFRHLVIFLIFITGVLLFF